MLRPAGLHSFDETRPSGAAQGSDSIVGRPMVQTEIDTNVYDLVLIVRGVNIVSGRYGGESLRTAEKGGGSPTWVL